MAEFSITNLHKRVAHHYTCYRVTSIIDEDIKLLKKINVCFNKLEKNNKDNYIIEIINITKTLNNVLDIIAMQEIFLELIDLKFQQTILYIIHNIDNFNTVSIRKELNDLNFD